MSVRNQLLAPLFATALLATVSPVQGMAISIEIAPSSAPNVFGGPSWPTYQTNALNSLENGLGNIGNRNTDPTAYEVLNGTYAPGDVMVTSGNSWRGQANPPAPFAGEHGNRLHFGLHIFGDGTTQFRLNDLTFAITSSDNVLDHIGNFIGFDFNCTSRVGYNWGGDRAKGGGDDIQVCGAGSGLAVIDELVYVGVGNAYWPDAGGIPGGSTLQNEIDGVVDYINTVRPDITGMYSITEFLPNSGEPGATFSASKTLSTIAEPASSGIMALSLVGLASLRRRTKSISSTR